MIRYKKWPYIYINETVNIHGKDIHGCTIVKVLSFQGAEVDYEYENITHVTYTVVTPNGEKYHKWTNTYCDPTPYKWHICECKGEC